LADFLGFRRKPIVKEGKGSVGVNQLLRITVVGRDLADAQILLQFEADFRQVMQPSQDLLSDCAEEAGIDLGRGLRFSFASDALIPLRAGYRTAMLGSVDELKAPANYHWPTDVPDNVDFDRVADAVRLCNALIRRLAAIAAPAPA